MSDAHASVNKREETAGSALAPEPPGTRSGDVRPRSSVGRARDPMPCSPYG